MAKKINFNEKVLIEYIRNFETENGYYPKYDNFNKYNGSPYSRKIIENIYGGINELYKSIGIDKVKSNRNRIKVDESRLKDYISEFYSTNNKYPRSVDFENDKNSPYKFNIIKKEYKTLANCYDKLGFVDHDTLIRNIEVDKDELIKFIERYKAENGFVPALNKFYKSKGSPYGKSVILKHYGSINAMYEKLGYEINNNRNVIKISKDKLLKDLVTAIYKYRTTDRDELRKYSPDTIYDRSVYERIFGSWTDAVKEAGFKNENRILMAEYPDYNGENPIEFLKIKIGENGDFTDKQKSIIDKKDFTHHYIRRYFKKKDFLLIITGKDIQWKSMQPIKREALDGHICDSNEEKIVDNFLFENNITHEAHGNYPNSRRKYDFKINDLYIEYAGLMKSNYKKHNKYKDNINEKIEFAKDNSIKLYILYDTSKKSLNDLLTWIRKNS